MNFNLKHHQEPFKETDGGESDSDKYLTIICWFSFQVIEKNCLLLDYGPKDNDLLGCGVLAIRILKTGEFLVGAGDGTVAIIKKEKEKFKKTQWVLP